eukprot:TRINITY_DN14783_c0_g1_i1.p1 TRINITY_DN14783_c0_g1~~TRINITY_DN14783_c0_g1_i1.p1  ORF type:complete len:131 (+),score=23.06 TRINITY_DN14783_c0_g1_i1:3-395(+)
MRLHDDVFEQDQECCFMYVKGKIKKDNTVVIYYAVGDYYWDTEALTVPNQIQKTILDLCKIRYIEVDFHRALKFWGKKVGMREVIHEYLDNLFKDYIKQILSLSQSLNTCLLYTSPSPRDATLSRMPSSA